MTPVRTFLSVPLKNGTFRGYRALSSSSAEPTFLVSNQRQVMRNANHLPLFWLILAVILTVIAVALTFMP
jgi:hypothetical protein